MNEIIKEAGGSSKALVYNDFNKYEKAIQRLSRQEKVTGKKTAALRKQLFVPAV